MSDHEEEARGLEWGPSREEIKRSLLATGDCEEIEFLLALTAWERSQTGEGRAGDRFRALRYLASNVSPYVLRIVLELFRADQKAEFQWEATLKRRDNPIVRKKIIEHAKAIEKHRIRARNEQLAIRVIETQATGLSLHEAMSKVALGEDKLESNSSGPKPRVYGVETVRKAYQQTLKDGQKREFLLKLKNTGYPMYERIPVPQITRGRPKKR